MSLNQSWWKGWAVSVCGAFTVISIPLPLPRCTNSPWRAFLRGPHINFHFQSQGKKATMSFKPAAGGLAATLHKLCLLLEAVTVHWLSH